MKLMTFQLMVSTNLVSSPERRKEKVKGDLKRVVRFLNVMEDDFH